MVMVLSGDGVECGWCGVWMVLSVDGVECGDGVAECTVHGGRRGERFCFCFFSVSVSFFLSLLRCVPNKERFPIPFRPL